MLSNRFSPLTFHNNSTNHQQSCCDPSDVREVPRMRPRIFPGNNSYAGVVKDGKNIAIIGDSIPKRIIGKRITKDINRGKAFVKSFPGATAKEISDYHVIPTLKRGDIDTVVICAGTNKIPPKKDKNGNLKDQSPDDIAEEIVGVGKVCRMKMVLMMFSYQVLPTEKNTKER